MVATGQVGNYHVGLCVNFASPAVGMDVAHGTDRVQGCPDVLGRGSFLPLLSPPRYHYEVMCSNSVKAVRLSVASESY